MKTRRKFIGNGIMGTVGVLFGGPLLNLSKGFMDEDLPQFHNRTTFENEKDYKGPVTVEKLYLLNGGYAIAPDQSIYTPGKWIDKQISLSCHAYLIRHKNEWILWDTGIEDKIIKEPGGKIIAHDIRGIVVRTIESQLAEIGISPKEIDKVVLSHAHFDHVGNAKLFSNAKWYIQSREFEAMFGDNYEEYGYSPSLYEDLKSADVVKLNGDFDLFDDKSIEIISTPGHTPGHCSLLVRLPRTGPVILSGDVAHYEYNMKHHNVPSMNSNEKESKKSMERIEKIVNEEEARLWINHDITQMATLPQIPSYIE